MKMKLFGLAIGLLLLGKPESGHATAIGGWTYDPSVNLKDIHLSYNVDLSNSGLTSNVYDLMMFNSYQAGTGVWWSANLDPLGGTITDPFAKSSTNMPLTGFIVGLTDDANGDTNGVTHVVAMMNPASAASYVGSPFPYGIGELTLISDLKYVTEHDRNYLSPDEQATWDADLNEIWQTFFENQASGDWFNLGTLAYPSAPGANVQSNFTAIMWSDGTVIGTGNANLTYNPSPVPEPNTMFLLGAGLACLASTKLKKRTA